MTATIDIIATGSITVKELRTMFNPDDRRWTRLRPGSYQFGPDNTEGTYAVYEYTTESSPKRRMWWIGRYLIDPWTKQLELVNIDYANTLAEAKAQVAWAVEHQEPAP